MLQSIRKTTQAGFTIIELLIVIAIIGILAGLVLNNFQGAQAKARDEQRKADINNLHGKLEEYYNDNGGYPDGNFTSTTLAGIDSSSLTDVEGATIVKSFATGSTAPDPTTANVNEYAYAAYSCTAASAQSPVGSTCGKYVLETFLERSPGSYSKNSLN
jgi:prepilin-type N-terminal cleavage/methylation domain-containing protein